jgi:hypothetical protein
MPRIPFISSWAIGPGLVAIVTWIAIVSAVDPAGSYPAMPQGPGLTVDEMFNVEQGAYLVAAIRAYGIGLFNMESVREIFGSPAYLPDDPPLGRLWLGLHHEATRALAPPADPVDNVTPVTACARTGSATAFALTIFIVGLFSARNFGGISGWLTSLLLALMPRLWGHAHLASLETITNLTCTLALLSVAGRWNRAAPPTWKDAIISGVWLGLAFLTKIQAIFLPPVIIVWAIWRWRTGAIKPLAAWAATAAMIFFVGWPWLWLDPVNHAQEYFGRTTARATLSVWYFGSQFKDVDVPWHYPWVMFAVTMPLPALLLAGIGIYQSMADRLKGQAAGGAASDGWLLGLLLGAIAFPLLVFSLPKTAVYDGERLFLTVFPLWAILAGRGRQFMWERIPGKLIPIGVLAAMLLWQAGNVINYHPCQLSFYNLLTRGASGAERWGLETTYWGEGVTRTLLIDLVREVPEGSAVMVAPVLHQFQLDDLLRQSPILRRGNIQLVPYTDAPNRPDYLLLFRRRADLPEELRFGPRDAKLLAETRRGRVQLAALYRLDAD